jgi:RHS repeat-associated protein
VIDPKGLSTVYTYDSLGDLTNLSSPDTGATAYGYDLAGNRTSETKADNVAQGYSYDALNRLTGQTFAHSAQNIGLTYDTTQADCAAGETFSVGRLTKITDASGSTRYCYDRFGNRVRHVQTVTSGTTLTVGATYNEAGRLRAITYPSGAIVTYIRDANGRITNISLNGQSTLVSTATYLPFGPLSTVTFGNSRVLTKSYDQNYDIDSVIDSAVNNPLSEDFTVNAVGDITGLTENTGVPTPVSRTFTYDGLDRLTAQKNGANTVEAFTYNSTGDRLSKTAGSTTNYTYPSTSHRLSAVGSTNRTYLLAGETLSIGSGGSSKNFTYDDNHRLSTFKLNNSLKYTNQYNGLGQRVVKIATTSANTRQFVYDESGRLLGEYTTTGALIREYVWLDDTLIGVIGSHAGTTYQYIETDHLGTPRVVVSPSNNAIVWRWDVNPTAFGEHLPNENPDGDANTFSLNLRYSGQYYDSESGVNYNYFRDYEPATGRYLESDPIGLRGGYSTYAYVGSSPASAVDPSGLKVLLSGHMAAGPGGRVTHPNSYHFALNLNPDDACKCKGQWPLTLGGQPLNGKLIGAYNYPGDSLANAQFTQVVPTPQGMTDCEFIKALMHASYRYHNNLPYSFPRIGLIPFLPDGEMAPGTYNSNSYISGILVRAGAMPPIIAGDGFQTPGYENPIPLK